MNKIVESIKSLENGKAILYPTDTVWGLGCDATNEEAVAKIYKIKKREESKSLIVLVSSLNMLKKYVYVPRKAIEIIRKSKKPTTIIYQKPKGIAFNAISKEDNTVAIRIVQDDFCRKLIKRFKKPIISTSANLSGHPTPKSFSEIEQAILNSVDYVVNLHQERVTTKSSTILKIEGNNIVVLRE
ncbi:L-threonylcarbamoyladenylate synthase [Tenacibaculum adriaticum]|uniref:L-threonylcarbamoyladenylate synthase n=1 Tax=Tenacibaculum adriaticum TaxID=413713 RepID=A0A5S5DVL8_9FLAO|nr:L-threonylcarbamoyladenylate synthase [Tenacibaculum adriaticum]TYP98822.1 L-threonylcarbamoyladenylate synthase [Tenacibaculum adriaticum]